MKNNLMRLLIDNNLYLINPDNITYIEYLGYHELAINFIGKENRIVVNIGSEEDHTKILTHINSQIAAHFDKI